MTAWEPPLIELQIVVALQRHPSTGDRRHRTRRDIGADELLLDRKLTALRAMATQTSGLTAILDPAIYAAQVAQECFIDTRAVAGSYSMQPVMGVRV